MKRTTSSKPPSPDKAPSAVEAAGLPAKKILAFGDLAKIRADLNRAGNPIASDNLRVACTKLADDFERTFGERARAHAIELRRLFDKIVLVTGASYSMAVVEHHWIIDMVSLGSAEFLEIEGAEEGRHILRNLDPSRPAPGALDKACQEIVTDEFKISWFHTRTPVWKAALLHWFFVNQGICDTHGFWRIYLQTWPSEPERAGADEEFATMLRLLSDHYLVDPELLEELRDLRRERLPVRRLVLDYAQRPGTYSEAIKAQMTTLEADLSLLDDYEFLAAPSE